jgi:hypothetical protein
MTTLNLAVFVLTLYVLVSACMSPTPPMCLGFCARNTEGLITKLIILRLKNLNPHGNTVF